MKQIIYILGIICLVILTSATTVQVMTIKPATPTSTIVKRLGGNFMTGSDTETFIKEYVKKGYITKSITVLNTNNVIIIMEKY